MQTTLIVSFLAVAIVAQLMIAEGCTTTCSRTSCSTSWWIRRCSRKYYKCSCTHCKWGAFVKQNKCTPCVGTCGKGKRQCEWRRSIAIQAHNGGRPCSGSSTEMREETCGLNPCPIHCKWGPFAKQNKCTSCSATCEKGKRKCEWRRNIAIHQRYGGTSCSGSSTEMRQETCDSGPCPIHCEWSPFTKQKTCTPCSVTCEEGKKKCEWRRNIAIQEQYGGTPCSGSNAEMREETCDLGPCPIDCEWGPFTKQKKCTSCSVTCEEGKKKCEWRRNIAIQEQHGGTPCSGSNTEMRQENCNPGPCPIDCEWGPFTKQKKCTPCSVTCEEGNKKCEWRRNIAIQAQYGGKQCSGNSTEMRKESCDLGPCPIDGGWSDWSEYSECSDSCNKTRLRTCTNPPPQYGGKYCGGRDKETVNCYEGACLDATCRKSTKGNDFHIGLPGTCVKFVKCNKATDDHVVFDCGKGTVWSDDANTCIHSTDETHCGRTVGNDRSISKEPCKDGERTAVIGHCNMYKLCNFGAFIEMPCPATLYFNPETNNCDSFNYNICNI